MMEDTELPCFEEKFDINLFQNRFKEDLSEEKVKVYGYFISSNNMWGNLLTPPCITGELLLMIDSNKLPIISDIEWKC